MTKNRLFNIFVLTALALMTALTIQGAIETTAIARAAGQAEEQPRPLDAARCIWSEVDRSSIRLVYLEEFGISLPRSDSGYTGYDGGLIYLLSESHVCPVEED